MEDYDYGYEDQPTPNKSIKGYQIIIIVLAVILAALSFLYYNQMNSLKKEYAIERDTLTSRFSALMYDFQDLQTENDTITRNLELERDRVDSLMTSLTQERNLNRAKIRQYEKELGTLRTVMRGYVQQIDSLNTVNRHLVSENITYRERVNTERLRADMAEEKADELTTKVRQGSVITAREISISALSNNDREVSRAARATRLRVDFTLTANALAIPGERTIFIRITGPDGYIMANPSNAAFDFQGQPRVYSARRDVDYQNEDIGVSIYYQGTGITGGKHQVEIYMDGHMIGRTEVILR